MTQTSVAPIIYEFGDFRLEPARRLLTRSDGRPVEITGKAFDALTYLVAHAGTPVARSELIDALWPRTIVEDNSLNKLMAALRRALAENGEHRYIVTLQGRGYQFVAGVRLAESQLVATAPMQPLAAEPASRQRTHPNHYPPGGYKCVARNARTRGTDHYLSGQSRAGAVAGRRERRLFARRRKPHRDLYVSRIGGSGAFRLTDATEPDHFPAWSPDGANIAFLRQIDFNSFDVIVVPTVGGRERRIKTIFLRPADIWGSPPLTDAPE